MPHQMSEEIKQLVETGLYPSENEVIQDGVRTLLERKDEKPESFLSARSEAELAEWAPDVTIPRDEAWLTYRDREANPAEEARASLEGAYA